MAGGWREGQEEGGTDTDSKDDMKKRCVTVTSRDCCEKVEMEDCGDGEVAWDSSKEKTIGRKPFNLPNACNVKGSGPIRVLEWGMNQPSARNKEMAFPFPQTCKGLLYF
jgi:hypothetical protein